MHTIYLTIQLKRPIHPNLLTAVFRCATRRGNACKQSNFTWLLTYSWPPITYYNGYPFSDVITNICLNRYALLRWAFIKLSRFILISDMKRLDVQLSLFSQNCTDFFFIISSIGNVQWCDIEIRLHNSFSLHIRCYSKRKKQNIIV